MIFNVYFLILLDVRYERTLLNGQSFERAHVEASQQGSVLGPIMLLIYINDITLDIKSNIRIFADDVSLFQMVEDDLSISFDNLQHDLNKISA